MNSVIPRIVDYYEAKYKGFTAGGISQCYQAWGKLTSDETILSDVMGAKIELHDSPTQHRVLGHITKHSDAAIVDWEILKLLKKRVVEEAEHDIGEIISLGSS